MRTILVADPNRSFATMVADELKRIGGYRVLVTSDGPETLQQYKAQNPHLVVLDGELPNGAAAELIRQFRQTTAELPVVLMPVSPADVPVETPVQGVLIKPFFLPDLIEMVVRLLGPSAPGNAALANAEAPVASPARPAVTSTLRMPSALRARLNATSTLDPATPGVMILKDNIRRTVESHIEAMSRALRDETVFLSQHGKLLLSVPRLSGPAAMAMANVVTRAWSTPDAPPEVLRFEGGSDANRFLLYSIQVQDAMALSVALRARVPLPIVRRVARQTVEQLLKTFTG